MTSPTPEPDAPSPDWEIVHEPIPGSPHMAYYLLDRNDPDFESGPHHDFVAAEDARTEEENQRNLNGEGTS